MSGENENFIDKIHQLKIEVEKIRGEISTRDEKTQSEIVKLRGELSTKNQELQNYAVERAEKSRNQAISILGFIALLGALGLWASIKPIVENAVNNSVVGQAARSAKSSEVRASDAANKADNLVLSMQNSIETKQSEWLQAYTGSLKTFSSEKNEIINEFEEISHTLLRRLENEANSAIGRLDDYTLSVQELLSNSEAESLIDLQEDFNRLAVILSAERISFQDINVRQLYGALVYLPSGHQVGVVIPPELSVNAENPMVRIEVNRNSFFSRYNFRSNQIEIIKIFGEQPSLGVIVKAPPIGMLNFIKQP